MGLRTILLYCVLHVITINKIAASESDPDYSPNVKVAVSVSDVFGFNNYIKKITEILQHQKMLESTLKQLNVTLNSTDSSFLLNAILQGYNDLKQKNEDLEKKVSKVGVTYIRWGRKFCDLENTELIYSGYVGGSHYSHSGASVDYVCLPPDRLNFSSLESYGYNYMYGAEYEINGPLIQHDVPCAVCRSTSFTTTLMVPGRNQCYDKWNVIYHGNLMAGKYDHAAGSSFICLDLNPESLPGGGYVDNNGILLYPVRTKCGSLKCPPYINDATLTCVVCGK